MLNNIHKQYKKIIVISCSKLNLTLKLISIILKMESHAPAHEATTTYTDVIKKFQDLNKQYYTDRGCMISTISDTFSKQFLEKHPDLEWKEKYNSYAEAIVFTAKINVNIFGKNFEVYLHRPIKRIHRYEYEYFFGFGGHNAGFSHNRIIMTFRETFDKDIDVDYLLMTGTLVGASCSECNNDTDGLNDGDVVDDSLNKCCSIDEKYIKNTLKLMVVGGYVKQWNAFNDFKKWFKDHGFNFEVNTDNAETMTSFIFEDYAVVDE